MTKHTGRPPHVVMTAGLGFAVRNYLLSDCPVVLTAAGVRLSVLTPSAADPRFSAAMGARGAQVQPLLAVSPEGRWARIRALRHAVHIARVDNDTWRLKQSQEKTAASTLRWHLGRLTHTAAKVAARPEVLRWLDAQEAHLACASPAAAVYRRLFLHDRPDLLYCTAPMNPDEWLPVQVARELGIPVVLGVLSWDNLSSKPRLPLPCDHVFVWSADMRREVIEYYPDVPQPRIHEVGAPQFDFYFQPQRHESRATFCGRFGLDPARPILVYAGVTPSLMPDEPKVVARLAEDIERGAVSHGAQLLLRLHPKDDGSRWPSFVDRFPTVPICRTGERHAGQVRAWQPDDDELTLLVNTVRHGDVHINVASTMALDAALADRPVVNVRYDLRPAGTRRSWGVRIYECTHYAPLLATGGVRVADDPVALVGCINQYLATPDLDREGRGKMVALKCGHVDGEAGRRVARQLLALLNGAR